MFVPRKKINKLPRWRADLSFYINKLIPVSTRFPSPQSSVVVGQVEMVQPNNTPGKCLVVCWSLVAPRDATGRLNERGREHDRDNVR